MYIMKKYIILIIGWLCFIQIGNAQQSLRGKVMEYNEAEKGTPVVGAILQWQNTSVGTVTDQNGTFALPKVEESNILIVSYSTYQNDTITVERNRTELNIVLSTAHTLPAISVEASRQGAYISVKPILTTIISTDGLRKAACCNLSESFDNTVAVDVEYADAVSGAKQISMLGLAGIYSQILLENTPYIRLLSNQFGLGYVPGTWMEGISVSKGTASVTNGYEAITGQINVDYKKPETNSEKLFINLYGNSMGKAEFNLNSVFKIKENLSTMLLLHTEGQLAKIDMNHDSFIDIPINYQVNAMNRWDYQKPGKFEGRTMLSYMWEDRMGGQMKYNYQAPSGMDSVYGLRIGTNKLNVITKNGFLLEGEHESIGTVLSFTFHQNKSFFGKKNYNAQQISGYANVLYSNRYGQSERHKLTVGGSVQMDFLDEQLENITEEVGEKKLTREEIVPGLFGEYSYSIDDKLVIMGGMRIDYNAFYKMLFWTPRIHLKWVPVPNSSFRISAGKGYRTANVLAENLSLMISNRTFTFSKNLKPEEAYNAGISFIQSFDMKGGKSNFSIDYFYTYFMNQVLIDFDQNPQKVFVYNLNDENLGGKSYSHSIQAEMTLYPLKRFEIIVAYRFNNVWQTTNGDLQQKALVSPHKALLNLNYATKFDKWKFNLTLQYNSSMRLPNTRMNPPEYQLPEQSPDFFILNAQITKKFRTWEIYAGGENLLNYKQKNPILSADNPFGEHFDASIIYAPITGAMGYLGIRWTLN